MGTTVDTLGSAVQAMSAYWPQTDTLMGGTQAMRAAGATYLPREKREKIDRYRARLGRSFIYPAYKDTVNKLGAAPFRSAVTVTELERMHPMVQEMTVETDREGRDITQFAKMAFTEAIHRGCTHILPDFPAQGEGVMRDQELETNVHPYLVHISPTDMLGWRQEEMLNGMRRLKQFRFKQKTTENDGEWGDAEGEVIYVYNLAYQDEVNVRRAALSRGMSDDAVGMVGLGSVEIWVHEQDKRGARKPKWVRDKVLPYSFVGNPLVTLYINQTGYLTGEPRFWDMSDLNVAHWQSDSDQRNILHVARVPLLFRAGVAQEEYDEGVTIGVSECISSKNADARMEWVETEGKAIAAGKEDGLELETRMEVMGLAPRLTRPVKTATGEVKDEVRNQSEAESWVRDGETAFELAFANANKFVDPDGEMPEGYSVGMFNEFSLSLNATRDLDALAAARDRGDISRETYLNEIKRRSVIDEFVDVQDEMIRIAEEAPDIEALMPPPTPSVDADDEEDDEDDEE